jgi:hypothetical protein
MRKEKDAKEEKSKQPRKGTNKAIYSDQVRTDRTRIFFSFCVFFPMAHINQFKKRRHFFFYFLFQPYAVSMLLLLLLMLLSPTLQLSPAPLPCSFIEVLLQTRSDWH